MVIGETTVKSYVASIPRKLDLRDRVQAVVFAYESGLCAPAAPKAARPRWPDVLRHPGQPRP